MVNRFHNCLFSISLVLLAIMAGCQNRQGGNPAAPDNAAKASPSSPAPEIELPVKGIIDEKFSTEFAPLITKLESARSGTSVPIEDSSTLVYVPANPRLLFIQTILKGENPAPAEGGTRLFILFDYTRGGFLGKEYKENPYKLHPTVDTQTVAANIKLVAENQGEYTLIQEVNGEGGVGSKSYRELVEQAVQPLDKLPPDLQTRAEQEIEETIGYACGINMKPELDAYRQAHLFILSMQGPNWADKVQGARSLSAVDPVPVDVALWLYPFLTDDDIGHETAVILAKLADDPTVFEYILKLSQSPAQMSRYRAAEILGQIPSQPEAAVEPLLKLVMDEDESVRQAAAASLNRLQNQEAIVRLLEFLGDPQAEIRLRAAEAFMYYYGQDEAVMKQIAGLLGDTSPQVRAAAARTLTYKRDPSGALLEAMTAAVKSESDPDALQAELDAINQLGGDEQILTALQNVLSGPSAELRAAGVARIQYYSDLPGVAGLLSTALSDKERGVREEAARTAVMMVMLQSSGRNPWTGDEKKELISSLVKVLDDQSLETRANAAQALGYFESDAKDAVPALIDALKNDDGTNGYYYYDALQKITGADLGQDPAAWEDWWKTGQGQ